MDFSLPDDLVALQETLRRFVADQMPREAAADWDKQNQFPRDIFDKLAKLDVMGLTVPEEHGGLGSDTLATMVVIEELSKRSLAIAVPYIMAACYAGMTITACGSPTQKKELLPRVVAGDLLFAYGWTEPDVGADLASVATTVVRDGDELVVRGAKRFCSGAGICDYIYTLVRSGPVEDRYKNLSLVLIPPTTPGLTIEPVDAMGMKGASTTDVTFDDVRVPLDSLVGGDEGWNAGWRMITGTGLDVEKLEVAAMALGIATAAFDDAWDYSRDRRQFGEPIASYQGISHVLADMQTDLHAARLMLHHAAWVVDQKRPSGVETSMTKLFVTEAAKRVVLNAQTVVGAYGYVKGFDIERYVRDILLMPIIGGSSVIQRNNIARWSGLNRSSASAAVQR